MTDALLYSLIAGASVGLAAGYIGSLMVLKRMALVGDALSHVALPGLALGLLLHFNVFLGAFAFLFAAAVATWYLEQATRLSVESIVGVLFVLALAIGILLTPEPDLLEALFGDIALVTLEYALASVAVSLVVVGLTRLIYTQVVLSLVSDELARSTGIRVSQVNFLYLLLVAVVVAAGLQIVGTLLVGALVIVPAAAMKNVSPSLTRYAILSSATGVVSAVSGILISAAFSVPAGPLVVIVGFVIFLVATLAHYVATRPREPAAAARTQSPKGA